MRQASTVNNKDEAKRHPLRLRRINLQSSIFNSPPPVHSGYVIDSTKNQNIQGGVICQRRLFVSSKKQG
jgi:hypothetical protein